MTASLPQPARPVGCPHCSWPIGEGQTVCGVCSGLPIDRRPPLCPEQSGNHCPDFGGEVGTEPSHRAENGDSRAENGDSRAEPADLRDEPAGIRDSD